MTSQDRNGATGADRTGPVVAITPPPFPADALNLQAEAELEAERAQARLDRFLARRPADFTEPGELRPDVQAWADTVLGGEYRNLVIAGPIGTGKTWTGWRIGEYLLRAGYRGRIEVVDAWQFKLLTTPPLDVEQLTRLATADLLALDDEGAVRISEWDNDHLYGIINDRTSWHRPTIINLNLSERPPAGKTVLEAMLGPRIASRVAKRVTTVMMTGPDRRRTQ